MTRPAWAATAGARALVFRDELPGADAEVWIEGPDGHHLQRVRRISPDEELVVADGEGTWIQTRVVEVRDGALRVRSTGRASVEPHLRPALTVAFAPAKHDHGVDVTHQLVELGVDRIIPLLTQRGVVRWDGARGVKQLERLRRVAREAAKQCHRARIPEVGEPSAPSRWSGTDGVVVADARGDQIGPDVPPATDAWTVLIGPEGGFAPSDLADLAGARRVAIGPHVLRSVTAPVAVAAALATRRAPS